MRRLGLILNQMGQIGAHQQLLQQAAQIRNQIQQRPPSPFEGDEQFFGALREIPNNAIKPPSNLPPRTLEVERLVAQFCNELNNELAAVTARQDEANSVAGWAHYRLVAFHPFHDGNGRTGQRREQKRIAHHQSASSGPHGHFARR